MRDAFLSMKVEEPVVKGVGGDPAAETCAVASDKGWNHAAGFPGGMTHPDLPGHVLHVGDDGKWAHMGPGDAAGRMHESGSGAPDLKRHLKTIHAGFAKLRKTRPPNPKTIEIDGDQDSIACVSESDDPTDSFRVGNVYPDMATSDPLFSTVGKRNKYRTHAGRYASKNLGNFGGKKAPRFKGQWTAAHINDLPDSSFAHIEPGGEKDEEGKTTPRGLRHLPFRDASGKVDPGHLRNALARVQQTDLPEATRNKIEGKLQAHAAKHGIGDHEKRGPRVA